MIFTPQNPAVPAAFVIHDSFGTAAFLDADAWTQGSIRGIAGGSDTWDPFAGLQTGVTLN